MEEDKIALDLVKDLGAGYVEQLRLPKPLSFILQTPCEVALCQS